MNYNSDMRIGIANKNALQTKRRKFSFLMVLLSLYVFFLYTAQETLLPPRIHSVVMYVFVGCTLLSLLLKKGLKFTISTHSMWYLVLTAFSFISFIWATNVVNSAVYSMVVSFVITFCFICVIDAPEKLDLCARVFVLSADAMGILLLLTGQLIGDSETDRLGDEAVGNANAFSALMMVAAVFAIWLLIYKAAGKIDKLVNLSSYIFILFMMALSGGRKTVIAVVISTLIFIVFKNGTKSLKLIKNITIAVIVLIVLYALVMNVPILYETIGYRFEELFNLVGGGTSDVGSDEVRTTMIKLALEKWQSRPILGYGVDTFKYYNRTATGHFYYAHNNYAELLYDLGLVGFLLYYGYMFKLGYSLLKQKSKSKEYKILGLALVIQLLVFDMGGVSYYDMLIQILLCIVFMCLKFGKQKPRKE